MERGVSPAPGPTPPPGARRRARWPEPPAGHGPAGTGRHPVPGSPRRAPSAVTSGPGHGRPGLRRRGPGHPRWRPCAALAPTSPLTGWDAIAPLLGCASRRPARLSPQPAPTGPCAGRSTISRVAAAPAAGHGPLPPCGTPSGQRRRGNHPGVTVRGIGAPPCTAGGRCGGRCLHPARPDRSGRPIPCGPGQGQRPPATNEAVLEVPKGTWTQHTWTRVRPSSS